MGTKPMMTSIEIDQKTRPENAFTGKENTRSSLFVVTECYLFVSALRPVCLCEIAGYLDFRNISNSRIES